MRFVFLLPLKSKFKSMELHYQLSDNEFELSFSQKELHPNWFSHEAHLRLAWIHIRKYGIKNAIVNLCEQIEGYAISLGANDKFNKTLTVAAIRAVHHFMKRSKTVDFQMFINEEPRLKYQFSKLIDAHYSFDILRNEKAKREYLAPDLIPFD